MTVLERQPQPTTEPGDRSPYASSRDHLAHEIERIDQLVRAQTVRWRAQLATHKSPELWGMAHVTEDEVETYLQSAFLQPGALPPTLAELLSPYWRCAAEIEERIARRLEATPPTTDLRLRRLTRLFDLTPLERDLLLVCLLPELDPRYRRLYGYLRDDATQSLPSVELAVEMLKPRLDEEGAESFDLERALLRHQLLVSESDPARALAVRSLRLDRRIADFLTGSDRPDRRLEGVLTPAGDPDEHDPLAVETSEASGLEALVDSWRRSSIGSVPMTLLFGPYGSGRLAAARLLAEINRRCLLVASVTRGLAAFERWETVVRLALREAALQNAVLLWTGVESLVPPEGDALAWDTLIATARTAASPVILSSTRSWEPAGELQDRQVIRIDFPVPCFARRLALWQAMLPAPERFEEGAFEQDSLASELANGFQFTAGQICDAIVGAERLAAVRGSSPARLRPGDFFEAARRQSGRRLIRFARRIEPRVGLRFEHLVLPESNRRQLHELRDRIRLLGKLKSDLSFEHRLPLGHGLVAMFTGTSGTGKTMAAELLAQDQGVDLYKVDLSAVVSKWVGETEKNLEKVFAEAETSNAILFFDEADALFGKRGDVKEAKDRWANLEINFLLQRIEEYPGIVVLTSNMRQNIDEAFLRRIQVIVDFPFPDTASRLQIWRNLFPDRVRRPPDEELAVLAERFQLPGGSLKNVVVDAAVRALADSNGKPPEITVRHLALGLAREYQKLGKPITGSEFGEELYESVQSELF